MSDPEPAPPDSPAPTPRLLIIIPALNEEASLPAVLADLEHVVPESDVVVIDDGSTDATAEVARASGATVIELPFNLGIGGALRTGFLYATRNGYDRAVQFDGDGQHDPGEIAGLTAALDAGASMVVGSRFSGEATSYEIGRVRARAMGVLRFAIRQLSGQSFTDTSSGFRAFDRPILEFFAADYPAEYMESVEALLLASAAGFRIDEVPVEMRSRHGGRPSNRRWRLVYHYLRLLIVIAASAPRRRPVREVSS